jgi:hypothetical protein
MYQEKSGNPGGVKARSRHHLSIGPFMYDVMTFLKVKVERD